MKKIMLLLAIAGMSTGVMAQETTTTEIPTQKHKVVTNGFWDNWFIDFGGDYISNYSDQEVGVSGNPFICDRGNWGFHVAVGKWATPSFGMRAKIGAAWGTQVNGPESSLVGNEVNPLYNQFNISLQPMLNLHNLFAGYKPRVWNTIFYGSVGWQHNTEFLARNSVLVGAGWLNTFNITKRFHINLDIYANMGESDMDGIDASSVSGVGGNTAGLGTRDWQIGWSVGCGFNLGKVGWDNAPDIDAIMAMNKAQLDALNASLADQQAENERLQAMIKNHKCPEAVTQVTEIVASSASVFFNINKSRIASKKDLVNVKELAECAKSSGKTIVVTGYADSKTGSASYNQKLSERRAEAVAAELVKMGVSRDKIEVVGKGGVKDLTPISYNRRVVVTLK
ncbi:MAG: OmpA family protein [Bacteroidaceae bacterium]|nr:OmpA family protein [Bacteroidaceae bacterium]